MINLVTKRAKIKRDVTKPSKTPTKSKIIQTEEKKNGI